MYTTPRRSARIAQKASGSAPTPVVTQMATAPTTPRRSSRLAEKPPVKYMEDAAPIHVGERLPSLRLLNGTDDTKKATPRRSPRLTDKSATGGSSAASGMTDDDGTTRILYMTNSDMERVKAVNNVSNKRVWMLHTLKRFLDEFNNDHSSALCKQAEEAFVERCSSYYVANDACNREHFPGRQNEFFTFRKTLHEYADKHLPPHMDNLINMADCILHLIVGFKPTGTVKVDIIKAMCNMSVRIRDDQFIYIRALVAHASLKFNIGWSSADITKIVYAFKME
jgi:hypothetical protein